MSTKSVKSDVEKQTSPKKPASAAAAKRGRPSTSDGRTRSWTTVVYPDSAPEGWLDILGELLVPALVSPLHDKDVNPDGEPKKPHWHVGLLFEGKKSKEQVAEYFMKIGGVGIEPISSVRSWARYLCHLDNPEKAQYDTQAVRSFGGVDYFYLIESLADKNKVVGDILDFILANDIISYAQLISYCRRFRTDWFNLLSNSYTLFFTAFLKSRAWEIEHPEAVRSIPIPDGAETTPSVDPEGSDDIPSSGLS